MKSNKVVNLFDVARINVPARPAELILSKKYKSSISTKTIKAVFRALRTLPKSHTCPCCEQQKHRDEFGIRVMKRDENGIPLVIRLQPWCEACRISAGGAKPRKAVWTSLAARRG